MFDTDAETPSQCWVKSNSLNTEWRLVLMCLSGAAGHLWDLPRTRDSELGDQIIPGYTKGLFKGVNMLTPYSSAAKSQSFHEAAES